MEMKTADDGQSSPSIIASGTFICTERLGFPTNSIVRISIPREKKHLGIIGNQECGAGSGVRIVEECGECAHWVLQNTIDGFCGIQSKGTGFQLSVQPDTEGAQWSLICRNYLDLNGWETFNIIPSDSDLRESGSAVGHRFFIQLQQPQKCRGKYLAASGNEVVVSSEKFEWEIRMLAPPSINVAGLRLPSNEMALFEKGRFEELPECLRCLCMQLYRASQDVGSFFIHGHAICRDVFSILRSECRKPPVRPKIREGESPATADRTSKANTCVVQEDRGELSFPGLRKLLAPASALPFICDLAAKYLGDSKLIGRMLVRMAAFGQQFARNLKTVPGWHKGLFHESLMALRWLQYTAGPPGQVMTARHKDATWLTFLMVEGSGLYCKRAADGVEVAIDCPADAILVNWGQQIEDASEGAFCGVCHWVVREASMQLKPRVSMALFFDSIGGATTTGC